MLGFTAFKTRKPREFDYRPRFYDPEQEAREERKKELRAERELASENGGEVRHDSDYTPGQYIGQMRMRRGIIADRRNRKTNKRATSIRMAIIVVFLVLLAWYIFS